MSNIEDYVPNHLHNYDHYTIVLQLLQEINTHKDTVPKTEDNAVAMVNQ